MRIVFLGAEKPSVRSFLISSGVEDLGIGFAQLKNPDLQYVPEHVRLHLHPGTTQAMSPDEWQEFSALYEDFALANADRFYTIVENYLPGVEAKMYDDHRKATYNALDEEVFRPVWRDNASLFELESMSDDYPHVMLSRDNAVAANRERPSFLFELATDTKTQYDSFGFHRPKQGAYGYRTVWTTAWKSAVRMGQTIIFTGRSLIRVNNDRAEEVRKKHAGVIASYGLDPDKVEAGDPQETTALAIVSLLEYQKLTDRLPSHEYIPDNSDPHEFTGDGGESKYVPDHSSSESEEEPDHKSDATFQSNASSRADREPAVVPVIETTSSDAFIEDDEGNLVVGRVRTTSSPQETVRQCNSCALARTCPAYEKDARCAYSLPVELRTQEQMRAFTQTLLEMQAARVAFARFAEELAGGVPDELVSSEMDRFMKMMKDLKKLDETTERTSVTLERRSSAGVLSSLFGEKTAEIVSPQEMPPIEPPKT